MGTKLWKKFNFWMKLRTTIASLGIGSEIFMHFADTHPAWKIIAGAGTLGSIFISIWIEDKNNNGVVDILEEEEKKD